LERLKLPAGLGCSAFTLGQWRARMNKLHCPHCKVQFPKWRLILTIRSPICPVCKSKLGFSVESAQRIGAICGLIFGVINVLMVFVFGLEKIWTWGFWGVMLPFSYVLGRIMMLAVGELVPHEQASWGRNKWNLFPNVSGIRRRFLWIEVSWQRQNVMLTATSKCQGDDFVS